MTQAAFWNGDWQAVCTQHDANSTDPAAWLRLAMAQHLLWVPADAALAASLALGATADDARAADRTAAILLLAQALLLSDLEPAALALIQQALPLWLDPAQTAPRARRMAYRLMVLAGALEPAEALLLQSTLRADVRTGPPVTLTAISSRLATLPAVIESLRQQTYRPAQVHLHLSHDPHLLDQGIATNDPVLEEITADGWVQLHWVPNLGPYRKIIPFLQEDGYSQAETPETDDDLFITVDDDTLYPPRFIEYLVRNYERHSCVVAHRGRRIRLAEGGGSGAFRPYAEWHDGVREPRLANLPTGQSGVLYRRSWFPQDLEMEAALALAPTHDDLWLRWLTASKGVQAVILQPNAAAKTNELAFPAASPEPITQGKTLWHTYNGPAGGNDEAVVSVQAYWQARGFDLVALLAEEQERQADFY